MAPGGVEVAMRLRRTGRTMLALVLLLQTSGAGAQERAAPDALGRSLQEVRELIRSGQHEAAIEAARKAKEAVEAGPTDPERLVQAHLLVALSYVNYGNFQANERRPMAAETLYKEARAALEAGLTVPALRTVQLDRAEYPPEMIELFERVRAEKF